MAASGLLVQVVGTRWIESLMPPVVTGAVVAVIGQDLDKYMGRAFVGDGLAIMVSGSAGGNGRDHPPWPAPRSGSRTRSIFQTAAMFGAVLLHALLKKSH